MTLPALHDATLIVPGSLGAHALAYVEQLTGAGRSEEYLRGRKRHLLTLFATIPAHTLARDVTSSALSRWMMAVRQTPRLDGEPRGLNGVLQIEDAARMFWSWMERMDLIEKNPWRRLPRGREQEVIIQPPSADQVQSLVTAGAGRRRSVPSWLRLRDVAIVAVLYDTGLRRAEIVRLRRGDVDREQITVLAKGGYERVIRFSDGVRAAIRAYVAAYEQAHGAIPADGALWWTKYRKPLGKGGVYEVVRGAGRRAGMKARPHLLRHAFGTDFVEATNDVVTAAVLLGHHGQDLRMTRRYTRTVERRRALRQHAAHSPARGLKLCVDD